MEYETFWPGGAPPAPGERLPLALRRLESGREKYSAFNAAVRILAPGEAGDRLIVRSRVGNVIGELRLAIERVLPDLVPGTPYEDYFAALRSLAD